MFQLLDKINAILAGMTRKLTFLGCLALLLMAAYITVDVILRKLFAFSTQGADELSGYLLVYVSAVGAVYALVCKAHIRIEFLYVTLRPGVQRALDSAALLVLAAFIGTLTCYAYKVWDRSVMREALANTPLHTPLWIPQGIWLVCLGFFCLVLLAYLVTVAWCLAAGRPEAVKNLIGCPELDENILEESGIDLRESGSGSGGSPQE